MATIGIIMPCYYSSEIVSKALQMLAWQTKKDEIEVIMVNDCSPNTNCEYQDLIQKFSNDLNIKYFKTLENCGPGLARQLGLNNCNCPWIMFHDDDDMLNNPYVIETYLEIINNIPEEDIVITIDGPHLQFWQNDKFILLENNFTGKLFNINIIKLFNISFENLSYEEDSQFGTKYFYYAQKLALALPSKKFYSIDITEKYPNFIAYTKQYNKQSICSTLMEYDRCWKALKYLDSEVSFYLSKSKDQILEKVLNYLLQDDFNYLIDWLKRVKQFKITKEQMLDFLTVYNKFNTIIKLYPNIIPAKQIELCDLLVSEIKGQMQ